MTQKTTIVIETQSDVRLLNVDTQRCYALRKRYILAVADAVVFKIQESAWSSV